MSDAEEPAHSYSTDRQGTPGEDATPSSGSLAAAAAAAVSMGNGSSSMPGLNSPFNHLDLATAAAAGDVGCRTFGSCSSGGSPMGLDCSSTPGYGWVTTPGVVQGVAAGTPSRLGCVSRDGTEGLYSSWGVPQQGMGVGSSGGAGREVAPATATAAAAAAAAGVELAGKLPTGPGASSSSHFQHKQQLQQVHSRQEEQQQQQQDPSVLRHWAAAVVARAAGTARRPEEGISGGHVLTEQAAAPSAAVAAGDVSNNQGTHGATAVKHKSGLDGPVVNGFQIPRSSSGVLGFSPADLGWVSEHTTGPAVLMEDTGLGASMDLGELLRDDGDFLDSCAGVGLTCCTEATTATTQASCGSGVTAVLGSGFSAKGDGGELRLGKQASFDGLERKCPKLQQLCSAGLGDEVRADAFTRSNCLWESQQQQGQRFKGCPVKQEEGTMAADSWVNMFAHDGREGDWLGSGPGGGSRITFDSSSGLEHGHSGHATTSNNCYVAGISMSQQQQMEQQQRYQYQYQQQLLLASSSSIDGGFSVPTHQTAAASATAAVGAAASGAGCAVIDGAPGSISGFTGSSRLRYVNGVTSLLPQAPAQQQPPVGEGSHELPCNLANVAGGHDRICCNTTATVSCATWVRTQSQQQQQQNLAVRVDGLHCGGISSCRAVTTGMNGSADMAADYCVGLDNLQPQQQGLQHLTQQQQQQNCGGGLYPNLSVSVSNLAFPTGTSPSLGCISPFQKAAMESPFGAFEGRFDTGRGAFQGVCTFPAASNHVLLSAAAAATAAAAAADGGGHRVQPPQEPPRPFGLDLSARQYSSTSGSDQCGFNRTATDWTGNTSCQASRTGTQQLKVVAGEVVVPNNAEDTSAFPAAVAAGVVGEVADRRHAASAAAVGGTLFSSAAVSPLHSGFITELAISAGGAGDCRGTLHQHCMHSSPASHHQQVAWVPAEAAAARAVLSGPLAIRKLAPAATGGASVRSVVGATAVSGSPILLLTRPAKVGAEDAPAADAVSDGEEQGGSYSAWGHYTERSGCQW